MEVPKPDPMLSPSSEFSNASHDFCLEEMKRPYKIIFSPTAILNPSKNHDEKMSSPSESLTTALEIEIPCWEPPLPPSNGAPGLLAITNHWTASLGHSLERTREVDRLRLLQQDLGESIPFWNISAKSARKVYPPLENGASGLQVILNPVKDGPFLNCMPVVQMGGQRCTGPAFGHTSSFRPPDECQIYVGQLPKDVYEDRIYPVFSRMGVIFRIRIVTKANGTSNGMCYVHYYEKEAAQRAVCELNGTKIFGESGDKNGIRIKILTHVVRLFICRIPKFLTSKDIYNTVIGTKCGIGLRFVHLPIYKGETENRGYCFLEYQNHFSAMVAWEWLLHLNPFGKNVKINWAVPEPQRQEDLNELGDYVVYHGPNLQSAPPVYPPNYSP